MTHNTVKHVDFLKHSRFRKTGKYLNFKNYPINFTISKVHFYYHDHIIHFICYINDFVIVDKILSIYGNFTSTAKKLIRFLSFFYCFDVKYLSLIIFINILLRKYSIKKKKISTLIRRKTISIGKKCNRYHQFCSGLSISVLFLTFESNQ